MQIGKHELLAGVPAQRLRDTLVKMDNANWSRQWLQKELGLKRADIATVIDDLVAAKYLQPAERFKGWYQTGEAAPRLVNVRFIKRIDRAKAAALIEGLLQRAKQINEDDRFVLTVTELRLFGSYLDHAAEDFGDVDVAFGIDTKPKYKAIDVTELSKLTQRRFPDIPPRNFLEFLFLPKKVVLRTLKKRSPYISLHPIEELAKIGVEGKVIFPPTDDALPTRA